MATRLFLILGLLMAFGPLAIDFYLPAFPSIATAFGTTVPRVQLSLASYFAGLALGQLFYGPVADRFGRRPPMLFGLVVFGLASVVCALAPNLEVLIVARFFQALGGCAGMVVVRAVVRDVCEAREAARAFSQLMLIMGVAPVLAPTLGSFLLRHGGWQGIFWVLVVAASIALGLVLVWLPETIRAQPLARPRLRGAVRVYGNLLEDRSFMAWALAAGLSLAGLFAYIGGSPFLLMEQYHVPTALYGWLFGVNAAGMVAVAQLNAYLLKHNGLEKVLRRAFRIHLGGAVVVAASVWLLPGQIEPLLVGLFVMVASLGCVFPNLSALVLARQGHRLGSASALMGGIQSALSALVGGVSERINDGTARPLVLVMLGCAMAGIVLARQAARRDARDLRLAEAELKAGVTEPGAGTEDVGI